MLIHQATILGIIQGITELLPISSSAHFFLITWVLGWNIPSSFDVALHFGTLLAIVIFFYKEWIELIGGGYRLLLKKEKSFEGKMFLYLIIATIPGAIIGFFLDKYLEIILLKPIVIACSLIIMGIALYYIDKEAKEKVDYESLTLIQTLIIGISQALAFIPGVSRSGITITTGRAMGIKRDAATKYSFLLSTPIILAATLFKIRSFIEIFIIGENKEILAFAIGVLSSFIVGMIAIKYLLHYIKKGTFKLFAIYRIIIGGIIIFELLSLQL